MGFQAHRFRLGRADLGSPIDELTISDNFVTFIRINKHHLLAILNFYVTVDHAEQQTKKSKIGVTMSTNMLRKFKYNHEVSFKYSFSSLGFDMYQAKFESSIPHRLIHLSVGKWFINMRFFKWQYIINKMTKEQLEITLLIEKDKLAEKNTSFHNPTFGF